MLNLIPDADVRSILMITRFFWDLYSVDVVLSLVSSLVVVSLGWGQGDGGTGYFTCSCACLCSVSFPCRILGWQVSRLMCVSENYFSYFSTKTYVVGTQKNHLNETLLFI